MFLLIKLAKFVLELVRQFDRTDLFAREGLLRRHRMTSRLYPASAVAPKGATGIDEWPCDSPLVFEIVPRAHTERPKPRLGNTGGYDY